MPMHNTLAIAKRELIAYFTSPVAYVVTAAFLVIMGLLFGYVLTAPVQYRVADLSPVLGSIPVILLLVAPALTMRLLSEEQRSGTIELLLTAPVRDWEVVGGKFLASLTLFLTMVALTLYYPLILVAFGNPDLGVLAASYIGVVLLGASFLSLGLLASSLSQNQVVAAMISFGLILSLWLVGFLSGVVTGPGADIIDYISIVTHYGDFMKGIVASRDVIYYLSIIAGALFLATRSLETRRWS
jgi:ABC-2 type transport system permease protein